MRGATEGAGDGWQTTGHARCYGGSGGWVADDGPCAALRRERGMDGRRRACIDCGIVTRRKAVSARLVVPGDRSLRKLTRWVAVWALCPGGHLMRPRTLQQFASICATSQLVQYPAKWCNTTYGQALAWARSAYRTREGATLHQLGMQCTTEHGNAPAIRQCIASTRGALPLISGVTCPQMRTRTHLATMRDHSQPIKWRHPAGLCTRCVALHPLRGAAPVAGRCTRSERVQCPRIGCTALAGKNACGTWNPATRKKAS